MYHRGLICTDLDGTLLFRDELNQPYIKERDLEALHKLRQSGYAIAIATGREVNGIRSFLRQSVTAFDYYIGGNGGLMLNQNFKQLYRKNLAKPVVLQILQYMKAHHPQMNIMGTDGKQTYFFDTAYANAQVQEMDQAAQIITLEDYEQSDIAFIMMNTSPDEACHDKLTMAMKLEDILRAEFGSKVNLFRNQYFLDFAPLDVSKGIAVEYLCDHLNLQMNQVFVIGDSWNDVSMFETKAHTYSFNHAEHQVQQKVDYVVEGFADLVEALDLLKEKGVEE